MGEPHEYVTGLCAHILCAAVCCSVLLCVCRICDRNMHMNTFAARREAPAGVCVYGYTYILTQYIYYYIHK